MFVYFTHQSVEESWAELVRVIRAFPISSGTVEQIRLGWVYKLRNIWQTVSYLPQDNLQQQQQQQQLSSWTINTPMYGLMFTGTTAQQRMEKIINTWTTWIIHLNLSTAGSKWSQELLDQAGTVLGPVLCQSATQRSSLRLASMTTLVLALSGDNTMISVKSPRPAVEPAVSPAAWAPRPGGTCSTRWSWTRCRGWSRATADHSAPCHPCSTDLLPNHQTTTIKSVH